MQFFLSYNRDELSNRIDQNGVAYTKCISQIIKSNNERVYFDDIDFVELDTEIYKNILAFMQNTSTVVLLLTDETYYFGWTQTELFTAIENKRDIYIISIDIFFKYYIKKRKTMEWLVLHKAHKIRYDL